MACGIDPAAYLPGEGWNPSHRRSRSRGDGNQTTMRQMNWRGVFPAITTPFNADLSVDHGFLASHCKWLVDNGCKGVVALGSLGRRSHPHPAGEESGSRNVPEGDRRSRLRRRRHRLAQYSGSHDDRQERRGTGLQWTDGLPPYVYIGDWREMKAHVGSILTSTKLPCMLYNNPIAYTTDFLPEHVNELLERIPQFGRNQRIERRCPPCFGASRNGRRPLEIAVGVDDVIMESVYAGAIGWIAGLVNAFPEESVRSLSSPAMERRRRHSNYTVGYSRCFGWIQFLSSSN